MWANHVGSGVAYKSSQLKHIFKEKDPRLELFNGIHEKALTIYGTDSPEGRFKASKVHTQPQLLGVSELPHAIKHLLEFWVCKRRSGWPYGFLTLLIPTQHLLDSWQCFLHLFEKICQTEISLIPTLGDKQFGLNFRKIQTSFPLSNSTDIKRRFIILLLIACHA